VLAGIAAAHALLLWAASRAMPAHEPEHPAEALIVQLLAPQAQAKPEPPPSRAERPRAAPVRPQVVSAAPPVEPPSLPVTAAVPPSAEPAENAALNAAPLALHAAPAVPAIRVASPERQVSITQVEYLAPPVLLYPLASRRLREQGLVHVRVRVDERGHPDRLLIVHSSGAVRLDEAALATVRATRFKPYTEDGVAMPFWVVMPLVFELET
jgi:protein TonB